MKRRILSLLLVLTLLMALPFAVAAEEGEPETKKKDVSITVSPAPNPTTGIIELNYDDTLTFYLTGSDNKPVTDGLFENLDTSVEVRVNNGLVAFKAADILSDYDEKLDKQFKFSGWYKGSSEWNPSQRIEHFIIVRSQSISTVTLTSTGYAYGAPASGFSVTSADAHVTPSNISIYEPETGNKDVTLGEKAYEVRLQLTTATGYSLAPDAVVTLDGKTGKYAEGGYYVFQLDELYPTYTITYNLDGGTISGRPTSYNKYSGTVTIPNPTKDGYRFLGWTGEGITEPQKDVSFEAKEMNRNLTYTAMWKEIIYHNVGFVTGHGATPQPQQVESGTKAARPADPTEDGWKFKGWYISDDYIGESFDFTTAITENTTLHAKWAKTWTVTFDSNGHGTAPAMQTVEEGENAVKPADPTAEGYSFQGWYTTAECTEEFQFDTTPITGNTTVYAKWVKKPIVSFNTNGHGTAPAVQTVELNGKAVKPADPTAEGYVFRGWYTTAACTTEFDFNTPIAADTTLYAKWDEIYTVTFNVGGHGTAPAAQKVENGGKATKPENPNAKGWRFDGWYTDEKCTARYDFDKAVTANTTLYAKWTQLFTLTFETNGGTKIDSVEAPDGSLVYLGSYKPTKSGYYFVGWYTDKNLTRASRVGYVRMDGNKTVYAKFAVADKTNPKTADPALPGLALAVLSFSTVGLAAMGLKKRK